MKFTFSCILNITLLFCFCPLAVPENSATMGMVWAWHDSWGDPRPSLAISHTRAECVHLSDRGTVRAPPWTNRPCWIFLSARCVWNGWTPPPRSCRASIRSVADACLALWDRVASCGAPNAARLWRAVWTSCPAISSSCGCLTVSSNDPGVQERLVPTARLAGGFESMQAQEHSPKELRPKAALSGWVSSSSISSSFYSSFTQMTAHLQFRLLEFCLKVRLQILVCLSCKVTPFAVGTEINSLLWEQRLWVRAWPEAQKNQPSSTIPHRWKQNFHIWTNIMASLHV